MKSADVTMPGKDDRFCPIVANMKSVELDILEEQIHIRRMELMAARLRAAGFGARTEGADHQFRYLCVYPSPEDVPGEWATLEECRRLLDTVANLPPKEAFARWRTKIEPLPEPEEW